MTGAHGAEGDRSNGSGSLAGPIPAFRAGATATAPALPGVLTFGVITGVATLQIGFSEIQTVAMSLLVFAGAAQLAAIQLLDIGAPAWMAVVAGLTVNLRLLMYSASIAPYLKRLSEGRRWTLPYLMVDQVYALSVLAYDRDEPVDRTWYYLGVGLPSWVSWQGGVVLGLLAGDTLPAALRLEFAVPLLFVALLVPTIESRETLVAAVVGGTVAVTAVTLPFQSGLLLGVIAGVIAGRLAHARGD